MHHALGGSGHRFVVCRHQKCQLSLGMHSLKEVNDFRLRAGIQITGWLIGQHDLRFIHQCPGDRDPLLFAAG